MLKTLIIATVLLPTLAIAQRSQQLPQPRQPGQWCPLGWMASGNYCVRGSDKAPAAIPKNGWCPAGARAAVIAAAEGAAVMRPTTKIRFTVPQIAVVMRAHPDCNLDRLTELSFEFDLAGKIVDCIGIIKDGRDIDHDYAGSGLARLYETARRRLAARQTSATILQFPNGERLANA